MHTEATPVFMDGRVKPDQDGEVRTLRAARPSRLATGPWPDYAQRHGFSGSELLAMAPRVLNAPR